MKKAIFILSILILFGAGAYFYLKNKNPDKKISPVSQNTQVSPTLPAVSQNSKKYLDKETGYSFEYPDNLEATKSENLKDSVYTDIKVTGVITGSINLLIEDTTAKTIADYLVKNKQATEGSQIIDTKLADLPAKKYLFKDKIWVLMLDQNVVYWFNADLKSQSQFWTSALDKIISSFAFEKVESSTNSASGYSDAGDVVDEGEEVVE